VFVRAWGSCGGKKEGDGPLGPGFDRIGSDNRFGCETWEQTESQMVEIAVREACRKVELEPEALQCALGGDLLNQCIATSYAMRQLNVPFLGLYGACSTMAEGLLLGSLMAAAGVGDPVAAVAGSHFCSAERQYRYPLEYGGQRPPTAQWTATATGAVILSATTSKIAVRAATLGRVYDPGVTDASNMGAAMAQAGYETLRTFFQDSGMKPADFDLIATGDLALIGEGLVRELFRLDGVNLGDNYRDCGRMLYTEDQDVQAGGSGAGCSAAALCARILPDLAAGRLRRVLFAGTGALLSPTSSNQGESIPGICHLVYLEGTQI
jgi:stage V sporulation protein AD